MATVWPDRVSIALKIDAIPLRAYLSADGAFMLVDPILGGCVACEPALAVSGQVVAPLSEVSVARVWLGLRSSARGGATGFVRSRGALGAGWRAVAGSAAPADPWLIILFYVPPIVIMRAKQMEES